MLLAKGRYGYKTIQIKDRSDTRQFWYKTIEALRLYGCKTVGYYIIEAAQGMPSSKRGEEHIRTPQTPFMKPQMHKQGRTATDSDK